MTGWHSLDTDELLLWAYMWFERRENSRFSEPIRQWALRLHTTRSTLSRNLEGLIAVNVIYPDKKNAGKTNDGWKMTSTYTVTEPDASVLRYAEAWWGVEAERGKARPSVPTLGHGEPRLNSGAPRVPKVDIIATTHEQYQYRSGSQRDISNRTLSIDSVGVPLSGHGETLENADDSRVPKVDHEENVSVEEQLQAAEAELKRLRRQMGHFQSEPSDEFFARLAEQGKEVKRLKTLLQERAR